MLKEVIYILKRAVETGVSKNINVRFHTNGTYLNNEIYKILENFKKSQIMLSIDGVDDINYFLRYPANWKKITNNIEIANGFNDNIELLILASLNSISAYYLEDLYNYVYSKNWNKINVNSIILGRVSDPEYLNPQTLDKIRKSRIKKSWNNISYNYPEVKNTINDNLNWIMNDNSRDLSYDTIDYVNKICNIRKIDKKILSSFINIL